MTLWPAVCSGLDVPTQVQVATTPAVRIVITSTNTNIRTRTRCGADICVATPDSVFFLVHNSVLVQFCASDRAFLGVNFWESDCELWVVSLRCMKIVLP